MTSTTYTPVDAGLTTKQKVGVGVAGLLSLANLPSVLVPTPDGEEGPPFAILVLATILGVIGLVAVVLAWRRNRVALRVAAGVIIVSALTSLPAFFVDVPTGIKVATAVTVVLTVVAVALMFSGRRPASVVD
jgi:hypothetical protein